MKAARFHGRSDIRIDDIPKPIPNDDEVLIEIEWCGICGTDLHEFTMGPYMIPTPDRPHVLTGGTMPVVLGHEFCGRIVQTTDKSDLKVGQAVMVDPRIKCYGCQPCKVGIDNLCSKWGFLGIHGASGGGGFSEFAAVDANMCHALPDSVQLDEAALIEPLAVGRHALKSSGIKDFSNVSALVLGGGPIGLSVLWNLCALGSGPFIVSEPSSVRRQQTQGLARKAIDPLTSNVGSECRGLTNGLGVDVVFDCAGVSAGLIAGLDAVNIHGTYVNVAGWEKPFVVPLEYAMVKEFTMKFSMSYDGSDYKAVVDDFVAGKFKGVEKMITSRIYLDDLPTKGFQELIDSKDHIKILATPKHKLVS